MKEKKKNILLVVLLTLVLIFSILAFFPLNIPIDNFEVNGTMRNLKKGDEVKQIIDIDALATHEIIFRTATFGNVIDYVNFDICILNEDESQIACKNVDETNFSDGNFIQVPFEKQDLVGLKIIDIKINDVSDDSNFTFYVMDNSEDKNVLSINDEKLDAKKIATIIGGYKKSYFMSWILFCIILIVSSFYFNSNNREQLINKWVGLLILAIVSIVNAVCITYAFKEHDFTTIRSILMCMSLYLSIYTIYLVKDNVTKIGISIERMFIILMIPIGTLYTIMIMPFESPDTQFHYASAYQLTNGNIGNQKVMIPKVVAENFYGRSKTYQEYVELIKLPYDYNDLVEFDRKDMYNILGYIPASIGIMVGKLLNLSPYIGMYIAKYFTFIVCMIMGFFTIRLLPFGKKAFMVYLLNPIYLQQATSFSIDAMINSFSILFLAYILYLKYDKKKIDIKDIILATSFLTIASSQKIVYVFLGLIVFILWKEIKKMSKKEMIALGLSILVMLIVLLVWYKYPRFDFTPDKATEMFSRNQYASGSIYRLLYIFLNTFIANASNYLSQTFGFFLSWTTLNIPFVVVLMYVIAIMLAIFSDKEVKVDNKKQLVILFVISFVLVAIAVMYALLVGWTYIGKMIIDGVQGRYFLPTNTLLLIILIVNNKYYFKKDTINIISVLLIVLNVIALITVLRFY